MGCSNCSCRPYVCTIADTAKSSLGIHLRSNNESDRFALEQYFRWIYTVANFGFRSRSFLSATFTSFSLGDDLIPTDLHTVGRGQKQISIRGIWLGSRCLHTGRRPVFEDCSYRWCFSFVGANSFARTYSFLFSK